MTPLPPRRAPFPALLTALACLSLAAATPPAKAQDVPAAALPLAVGSYTPIPVDFGFVPVQDAAPTTVVTVRNLGSADLEITSLTSTHAAFTVTPGSLAPIPGGGSASFEVTFDPAEAGAAEGAVVIQSNDAFTFTLSLPVTGLAVDIAVAIAPGHRLLVPSQSVQFVAEVTGSPDPGVTWSVEGAGTISATGLYKAPDVPGSAVVRATSTVDETAGGVATVSVIAPEWTEPPAPELGAGRFGTVVLSADLDGDRLQEVIVGAPEAAVDAGSGPLAGAGAVWVHTFGPDGFEGAPRLLTSPAPVAGGAFGTAMTVADLDGDGRPDLAVGEPGGSGAVSASGAVQVFFGDPDGTLADAVTAAPPQGAAGDRFGTSLAAGLFDGGSVPLLAVGAPGREVGGQAGAGAVELVNLSTSAPAFPLAAPVTAATPEAGMGFGTTLAAACLDGCTRYGDPGEAAQFNDLVVGAPDAAVSAAGATLAGAGRVFAVTATLPGFAAPVEVFSPAPAAGAAFGAALAAGDLNGDVLADLVVGSPGQTVQVGGSPLDTGVVFVFATDGAGGYQPLTFLRDPAPDAGHRFGAAVRVMHLDHDGLLDLAVGAPAGPTGGSVDAYHGTGTGDFDALRRFTAKTPAPGDGYGTAFTWADVNLDGIPDILAGAPAAVANGAPDGGALDIRLDQPPETISITPAGALLARGGSQRTSRTFVGSDPEGAWSVLGEGGTIDGTGKFTARAATPDRLSDHVTVMLRDPADPDHWALARVTLVDSLSILTNPEAILQPDGTFLLGIPEAGAHFGSTVAVAPLGRNVTDPFRAFPAVLGAFPSVDSSVIPRVPRYPYDDDPLLPFTSIQFYFGRPQDVRTGWGAQMVTGDFDGDGNTDIAVSAPFAPSDNGTEVQIGFVDILFLDDQGAPSGALVRITPSQAMVRPDGGKLWTDTNTRSNIRYGYRLLAHDLNQDGRDDVIVGFPHADLNGIRDAGLVEVLLAPPAGNWVGGFTRVTLAEPTPRVGGYFGSSLAAGDLTGDNVPELFVGAPGLDPEGLETSLKGPGMVHGFAPVSWDQATSEDLRIALSAAAKLSIADPVPPPTKYYSGFGLSLAMADFLEGDTADELVVGSPLRIRVDPVVRDHLGVPRKRETGGVDLFDGDGGFTVRHVAQVYPPLRQTGMHFGESLAAGRLTGPSGPQFLAVAAPFYDGVEGANTGAVLLYEPDAAGRPRLRSTITSPEPQALDQFGQAITLADVNLDGRDELVVGAPNTTISVTTGYRVYPGRFRGPEAIIETQERAGKVYVMFPGLP